MRDVAQITDRDSLHEWLEDQPRAVAVAIAARAAARVLPVWWDWSRTDAARQAERVSQVDVTALPVLRCCLISTVAVVSPTNAIKSSADDAAAAAAYYDAVAEVADPTLYPSASSSKAYDAATKAADATVNSADTAAVIAGASVASASANSAFAEYAKATDVDADSAWDNLRRDATMLAAGGDAFATALWTDRENPLDPLWTPIAKDLRDDPVWSFWVRWYQGLLDGTPMPLPLLTDIALIESEVWDKGAEAVAEVIRKLEDKHTPEGPANLQPELDRLPPPKPETVATVRAAMERNRAELPPTYDAIEALILLEIERLQNRNYRDEEDREESLRQIRTYLTLHAAIVQMREQVPAAGPVSETQAEQTLSVWQVYKRKLAALPREKADELAEGVWETGKGAVQFGLIAGSTYLATMIGLPPNVGMPVSALLFAPKKAGAIIKAATDALLGKSG